MTINKNILATCFLFLLAQTSSLAFKALSFSNTANLNGTAIVFLICAVASIWINFKTDITETLSNRSYSATKIILFGVLGIFASIFIQGILALIEVELLNQPLGSENTEMIRELIKKAPLFMIAATIAGPIMEEFVFRFSLINFLNQKLNIWVSAVISSFLFAAIHMDGHYLLYGGLGFFLFLLYKKTGSIYTSIIAHVGMNTLVLVVQLTQL